MLQFISRRLKGPVWKKLEVQMWVKLHAKTYCLSGAVFAKNWERPKQKGKIGRTQKRIQERTTRQKLPEVAPSLHPQL